EAVVTAHIQLRQLATAAGDPFGEAFHRGVGLLLLVKEQDGRPDRDPVFCEEMLCKSLRALGEAKDCRPADPRVRIHLAEVYDRAGSARAGDSERRATRGDVAPGVLTPAERKALLLGSETGSR
ncbi:MAG: hypothetical protein K2V38_20830, partial [Gemmataceae bacterium]|nr:hypothetical protein [Gemmataceae bacterium]